MDQTPTPEAEPAVDLARKQRLVNGILVAALAAVGLVGGWVMFDAIYTPGQPLPLVRGVSPKNAPAAKPKPESTEPTVVASPEVPAVSPLPAAPGAQTGEGQYVLQMGVFGNASNAEELRAKLDRHGLPASIETRVTIGPFGTQEEVDVARTKLKDLGLEGGLLVTRTKRTGQKP